MEENEAQFYLNIVRADHWSRSLAAASARGTDTYAKALAEADQAVKDFDARFVIRDGVFKTNL